MLDRPGVRSWQRSRGGAERSYKSVAAALHGFYIDWGFRVVLERLPNLQNVMLEHLWLDVRAGPQRVEKFLVRHEPTRVLQEVLEQGERLGRQQDTVILGRIPATPQALIFRVEPESQKLHGPNLVRALESQVSLNRRRLRKLRGSRFVVGIALST